MTSESDEQAYGGALDAVLSKLRQNGHYDRVMAEVDPAKLEDVQIAEAQVLKARRARHVARKAAEAEVEPEREARP